MGIKLEIGSGEYPRFIEEGYLHADVRSGLPHQEYCFDLRDPLPFDDNTIESIAIIHCLEHLSWRLEVLPSLKELHRVLIPGGDLFIIVPNLLYVARLIIDHEYSDIMDKWHDIMQDIYCIQDFPDNFHKSGFTPNMIKSLMSQAGFINITITPHTIEACAVHIKGYK